MEEKTKKKAYLYLLLGIVFIIVVALGGVYAYFSSRVNNSGDTITGSTLDIDGSTISIEAERLDLEPSPVPTSDNLVPAKFGVEPTEMTTTQVNRALTRSCVNGGFTGCHVWKITASTTLDIASANIRLNLNLSNVTDKNEWSYVVYTGTDSTASTVIERGKIITDFPNINNTIDIHHNAPLTSDDGAVYYVMVYLNNTDSTQNDGTTNNTTSETGTYNGTVYLEAMGGEVKANFVDDAVEYITNLYTNANKSTTEVNDITYTLAPSVNLMRDQFGSSSSSSNTGNLRYYGANPNNYVWLGDYYTEDMTIEGNITEDGYADYEECVEDGNSAAYCSEDIVVEAGDKKLWRIVGIFDGKLKLISDVPISTQGLSWDTSANDINTGGGINEWGPSGSYEGADLMRLLNPGYTGTNGSLYWNKSTGTVYTGYQNATTSDVSFESTGLSAKERKLIDDTIWYTGAYSDDSYSYADVHYTVERGTTGKICSSANNNVWCNDTVERTFTWNGKVGLIYPSDLGYGTDLNQCDTTLDEYYNDECATNNWLVNGKWYWTLSPRSPRAYSYNASYVFGVGVDGNVDYSSANSVAFVRPAVYLKSGVTISGGNGSGSDPFVLW